MNRLRQLIARRRMCDDLAAEIRQHLEEKVEAFLAAGMSRAAAERRARLEFGNAALVEERSREVWSWQTLEAIWTDLRYALRQARRSPGFAMTAVIILALGVGINSAIFSVVRHALLEPLPFPQPERLYAVWARSDAQGNDHIRASGPNFLDYLDQNRSFSHLAQVLVAALRGGPEAAGRSHRRSFSWLVVAEIACSLVLAIGAGLLLRSFWRIQTVDLGFRPESMLTVYLRTNYYTPKGRGFWKDVLDGVAALPGVGSAALADCTPGKGAAPATLVFDDRANDERRAPPARGCWISGGFFRASGARLVQGRTFTDRDDAEARAVVIVNAEAASRYWPGGNPIGRRIGVNYTGPGRRSGAAPRMREVVGVVRGIKQGAPDSPTEPAVYMPYLQDETSHDLASMSLFVRSQADPRTLAASVRARIHAVRPDQPVEDLQTMQEVMAPLLAPRRYSLFLLVGFAALAVLLAALGVYGVVAYTSARRTREFGVRMALGATRRQVVTDVLRQGLALTAIGLAAGAGVAVLATRTLSQLLFQVRPLDGVSFASAIALLVLVALVACSLPAWRASRVDPARALKGD